MRQTSPGRSFPLGASVTAQGANFSIYSRSSTAVELLLFDSAEDGHPAEVIPLDPHVNRTFHFWHIFVEGIRPGQLYGYRVYGPFDPANGLRFDPQKVLLDPYGRAVVFSDDYTRAAAIEPGDNAAQAIKSVVVDPSTYDWQGDLPLQRPFTHSVIYELHLAGFTKRENSGVPAETRGTYAGLIEKIPYLKELGITAVELMPIFAFDPQDAPPGLSNYWGYSPLSFFAPHPFYSSRRDPLGPLDEFRDMVRVLHKAGLEVILDVVYNHTCEGNHSGPTISLRGLENPTYYILEQDQRFYANFTGTGNTLNTNHPIVRRMIIDSLRYWVDEMHVDGFRFDLASIFSRSENGQPCTEPPTVLEIENDPALAGAKLIAEAWDASGLYQVGSFIGERWNEWNGRFRDDIRAWVRGEWGAIEHLPLRMLASPDLYLHEEREPTQSINFVACHDGFTLNDVVSFNAKHNLANGENNRDGMDDNRSWNHGLEGPTDDAGIERLRNRQVKNFVAYTLLAMGAPMLGMGDEVRRSQAGNNNAYCQDNELSWFDWSAVETQAGLLRFVRGLIKFRLHYVSNTQSDRPLSQVLREAEIAWHGVRLGQPDWSPDSRSLALTVNSRDGTHRAHILFNTYWEALEFELPPANNGNAWHLLADTNLDPPHDMHDARTAPPVDGPTYLAAPRSVVILVARA